MTELAGRIRGEADKLLADLEDTGIAHDILKTIRAVIYPVPRKKGTGYTTYIYKEGRKHSLGTFDTMEEALSVRLKAANDLYGEFAESA